ncbi:MAG: hypothetical protein U0232_07600 [Thermomicrobiales bacterium]
MASSPTCRNSVGQLVTGNSVSQNIVGTLIFILLGLVTIAGIVLINEGQRRITVNYACRVRGNRQYGGPEYPHPAQGQLRR